MFKDKKVRIRFITAEVAYLITICVVLIHVASDFEFLKEFLLLSLLAFIAGTALNLVLIFVSSKLKKSN